MDDLSARLDEDEAVIRENLDGRGLCDGFPDYRTYTDADTDAADKYIDHFGPARELREVEAKRAILAEYDRDPQADDQYRAGLAFALELLADAYRA